MPETDPQVAENCTGTFQDYHGPIDGPTLEDATLIRCDGCGEVNMIRNGQKTTLIPGKAQP